MINFIWANRPIIPKPAFFGHFAGGFPDPKPPFGVFPTGGLVAMKFAGPQMLLLCSYKFLEDGPKHHKLN